MQYADCSSKRSNEVKSMCGNESGPKWCAMYSVCLDQFAKEYTSISEIQWSQQPIGSIICTCVCVHARVTATHNRCEIERSKQKWIKRLNDRYNGRDTHKHTWRKKMGAGARARKEEMEERERSRPVLIRWRRFQCIHTSSHASHWNRWLAKLLVLSGFALLIRMAGMWKKTNELQNDQ